MSVDNSLAIKQEKPCNARFFHSVAATRVEHGI